MNITVYVRVSTQRQAQAQTIEQQLDRLRAYHEAQGWPWQEEQIFRDDGYSGAKLRRLNWIFAPARKTTWKSETALRGFDHKVTTLLFNNHANADKGR